ncbi:uncharacterized protein EI97DRAFT_492106 [Westerdykella ornata]|uniref:Uncharacterized protein n=1 Tax=Westerdykella ornata TaxID=318751 RepID=A0A6A6JTB4_WESOR|nr:uncharacterized protein EI97DRAFT_492106 [Westerdykella ornata]KAF2279505.1 hypothetical protein EI97DRAFT_492106 [Westerdykella ornata]
MSVGFGFSVGDFLAALRLVGTVIDALRESSSASSDYRDLLNELLHLETALIHVKRVELDESQYAEKVALRQAAAQCQRTIDEFWKRIQAYQSHLRDGGTGSRVKDGWVKIKWALCKKDDLEKFKANLRGHTSSIEILLVTVQMNLTSIRARQQDQRNKTLAGKIEDLSCQWMTRLSTLTNSVAQSVQQGKLLLESSAKVLQMNLRIFQMVYDIQQFIFRLPTQVQRQQPVYMIDAFGRESPFHLEFVRLAEALIAILKVNLKASGCGPAMIDRGAFAIRKAGMQSDVDLQADWDTCFFPGDRVAMSMVFNSLSRGTSCPSCGCRSSVPAIIMDFIPLMRLMSCSSNCGTTFQRVTELTRTMQPSFLPLFQKNEPPEEFQDFPGWMTAWRVRAPLRKRARGDEEASNIRKFRRVRLMNPKLAIKRCEVFAFRDEGWIKRGAGNVTVRSINVNTVIMWMNSASQLMSIHFEKKMDCANVWSADFLCFVLNFQF